MPSALASICFLRKPSIAPLRMMLSIPESSGLNPAPISINGAIVPRMRIDPEVGG